MTPQSAADNTLRAIARNSATNLLLACIKGAAGILGNSYALVADALESVCDTFSSLVTYLGVRAARRPPDDNHPYGHGKYETLAALIGAGVIILTGVVIADTSIRALLTPHQTPHPATLAVLGITIGIKEYLFRKSSAVAKHSGSIALETDAWHHRTDALTSIAAGIGIIVALIGGPGYEGADDIAAILAAGVIMLSGVSLLKPALDELLDAAPDPELVRTIRACAAQVPGVFGTHKCLVRKLGFDHYVDLDVLCDPTLSIREGHRIAHEVGSAIHAQIPLITKVLVHIEPHDDYGRR
jgi:cation diffusion facilitator family transporter